MKLIEKMKKMFVRETIPDPEEFKKKAFEQIESQIPTVVFENPDEVEQYFDDLLTWCQTQQEEA